MRKIFILLAIAGAAVAFFGCGKDNSLEKLRQDELRKLDEFIAKHYPDSVAKPSGLYYIEEIKGEGDSIKPGNRVQVFYATWTIDSVLVDQSEGYLDGHRFEPLEYKAGANPSQVIKGLEEASKYMQKGTKAHLVIPSELAYGQNGQNGIPGFTTLLMEVEVYKIYEY